MRRSAILIGESRLIGALLAAFALCCTAQSAFGQQVHYVNGAAAIGTNNGQSWATAFRHLQDALAVAQPIDQIWVAGGTYRPDESAASPTGTGSRTASFVLANNVALYGGFVGTESSLGERDLSNPAGRSILSGDLLGNDAPGFINYSENSYRVVIAGGSGPNARLDGFVIRAGNANGQSPNHQGAGIYATGDPRIRNCTIEDNSCSGGGGGIYATGPLKLVKCIVQRNRATNGTVGGGLRLQSPADAEIFNCVFTENQAASGGAVGNISTSVSALVVNSLFVANRANNGTGGAIEFRGSLDAMFCTFWANYAGGSNGGAAVRSSGTDIELAASILWGNSAPNAAPSVTQIAGTGFTVRYSDVQGGYLGTGNIDVDPEFFDTSGPDQVIGTADDDLRLTLRSPCVNNGHGSMPPDRGDVDDDGNEGEPLPLDLAGAPRIGCMWPDMGAFEYGAWDLPDHVVVVDGDAAEDGEGDNWCSPYRFLSRATNNPPPGISEIWVAEGIYRPDESSPTPNGNGNRSSDFRVDSGMSLIGGFSGQESERGQADPKRHVTNLSGDLAENDRIADFFDNNPIDESYSENSFGIITTQFFGTEGPATVDGVTITGATSLAVHANCDIEIRQCKFVRNHGAVHMQPNWSLIVADCEFIGNYLRNGTAIVEAHGGATRFDRCRFDGNKGDQSDAVVFTSDAPFVLENCLFSRNTCYAIRSFGNQGSTSIANSTFFENTGQRLVQINDQPVTVQDSLFWHNVGEVGVSGTTVAVSDSLIENGLELFDTSSDNIISSNVIDEDPMLSAEGLLTAGSPCINAGGVIGASVLDVHSEPRTGSVDIGADEFVDADADSLPDAWELQFFGALSECNPAADDDGDGIWNEQEFASYGTTPSAAAVFVNAALGDDAFDGSSPTVQADGIGPKKHLQAGIDAADDGGTVLVAPGVYADALDRALAFHGQRLALIATGGPDTTTINVGGLAPILRDDNWTPQRPVIQGFTLTGGVRGNTSGSVVGLLGMFADFRNCRFIANEATDILADEAVLRVNDLSLTGDAGDPVCANLTQSVLQLDGPLHIESGEVEISGKSVDGPGEIVIADNALLRFADTLNTIPIRNASVNGLGDILVEAPVTIRLERGSRIDLSGSTCPQCCADPDEAASWGSLTIDGKLLVEDSTIQNTNVEVRLGTLIGATDIVNNDLRLVESAAGYGGEFFVSGASLVQCNVIRSDGDRYLDLDPDPTLSPRPTIGDNRIFVTIKQGVSGDQGELLELRTQDFDLALDDGRSGAHPLAGSAGYDDTWVLDRLEVLPNAKVTLTNRPGFVFQDPQIPHFEALYVKQVKLHSGAVLNTGLQRMYYQSLVDENGAALGLPDADGFFPNGARLVDSPLLGFSLKVIAMEDDTEFAVRVRPRLRDPDDEQPADCEASNTCREGAVERIADPSNASNSILEVKTKAPNRESASTVSAHGAFARAGEDQVVVAFQYRFCGNAADELIVHLSDAPEAGDNLIEIARIKPPADGPGSIGSIAFATFSGLFPRGNLNFRRGTYVELELIGDDACIQIDDWDPLACGSPECGDYDLSYYISNVDMLYGLTAMGGVVGSSNSCLDRVNRDNYVDATDLLLSDALYGYGVSNLCSGAGSAATSAATQAVDVPTGKMLVSGKSSVGGDLADRLYPINATSAISENSLPPPVDAGDPFYGPRGHGRLVRDGNGDVYQLHATQGLVRLRDGRVIVAPGEQEFEGNTIRVGMPASGDGLPIFDAAFDPNDANTVFVVPARVVPPTGEADAYLAAVRLSLTDFGESFAWSITQSYGYNPQMDPGNNTQPPQFSQTNVQYLREIETDSAGNLFVTCARADNANDWLLIYDSMMGTASEQRLRLSSLPTPLRGPTALHVASNGGKLYVSSSYDQGDSNATSVQELSLSGNPGAIIVTPLRHIDIANMRFATSIAEGAAGEVYVVGYQSPSLDPQNVFFCEGPPFPCGTADGLFTMATIAQLPPVGTSTAAVPITGSDLALPLSAIFVPSQSDCLVGDVDGSGAISVQDAASFVSVLLNGPVDTAQACRADANADNILDGRDIEGIVSAILGNG